ncbi:MAG: BrnT family toxin [Rhizobiaceae bacterium]
MQFEWDETKRQQVISERGVDILYAALIFEGEVLTRRDDRRDYGEERLIFFGLGRRGVLRRRPHRAERFDPVDHSVERRPR